MSTNRGKAALFDDASFEINKEVLKAQAVQKVHDTQDAHNTQGTQDTHHSKRKQKHPRINMAFYGDNLDYLRNAAWAAKMSVTEYVNTLISMDREKNK